MSTRRPVAIAVSMLCLLQACASPSSPPAVKAMHVEPVLHMQHSGTQTASTYYQLGKFHQARGNMDAARAAYLQSVALDGHQADARNALAVIDAKQGRLNDAVQLLEAVVRDYPQDAYLQNNLAYVQYLRHDYSAALSALERALTIEPGNARAHANLDLVQAALIEKKNALMAEDANTPAPESHAAHVDSVEPEARQSAPTPQRETFAAKAIADARAAISIPSPAELRREASALALRVTPAPAAVPAPIATAYSLPEQNLRVVQLQPNVIELRPQATKATVLRNVPVAADAHPPHVVRNGASENEMLAAPATHQEAAPPQEMKRFRVDIANGNGVEGMAARMRKVLEQRGIAVGHLSNKKPYDTAVTEIQYRAGYLHEAEHMQSVLQAPVTLAAVKGIPANADVRLLLGKDAGAHLALLNGSSRLALNDRRK